jgi:hypothetical protein
MNPFLFGILFHQPKWTKTVGGMTWQLTSSDQVIKKEQDKNKVLPLLRIS